MKLRIVLAMLAMSLIWGSTWMAIRVLVLAVPPMHGASLRFLLAAVVLFPFIVMKRLPWPAGTGLRATVILSFTMVALPSALTFWSEQRLSSGMTALIFGAMPLMTAILTPCMAGRKAPRMAWLAMIAGLIGLALVVSHAVLLSGWQVAGAVAVLTAVFLYAASSVFAKEALLSVNPLVSTAIQFFLGGVWLAVGSAILERGALSQWSSESVIAVVFLAVFPSALTFTLYYWLLKHIEAYQLTSLQLVVPIVAVIEGSYFLQEAVPWTMVLGTVIVLASVAFVLRAQRAGKKKRAVSVNESVVSR